MTNRNGSEPQTETPRKSAIPFWLAALNVRLRFLGFVAAMTALSLLWPWLSAWWDRSLNAWSLSTDEQAVSASTEYFCPMDPGVVSAWPAICPICNMDLIRRSKSDAVITPDGALARMQISPYKLTLAGIRTIAAQSIDADTDQPAPANNQDSKTSSARVQVPSTSVLYREQQPLIYVESMPGMFDAIPVEIDSQTESDCIVRGQLAPGSRVAVMGNLLLDAETRLKPNLSTQYFGASQASAAQSRPELPKHNHPSTTNPSKKQPLSPGDQQLVDRQKICPITQAALDSMGGPVFVEVANRRMALCCEGCRRRVLSDPAKYAQWFDMQMKSGE